MKNRILALAVPNIISNLTVPLLGMVDLALLGRLESEKYLGAIALGTLIFNFIYWGFGFLRMGTTGFAAQQYGEKNHKGIQSILLQSLFLAAAGSLLVLVCQRPIEWFAFELLEGSAETEALAAEYFRIRIFAAPATLMLYVFSGWFLGLQNARYPLWLSLVTNILNIGFSFLFIQVFKMHVDGAAWGSLLAQYGGLFMALYFLKRKYAAYLKKIVWKDIFRVAQLKRLLLVNRDILLRTICLLLVINFFTAKSAAQGDMTLAVNTLLMQFSILFSYLMDGFAFAGEALIGKSYGARNQKEHRRLIRSLFAWGFFLAVVFSAVYALVPEQILLVLTTNQSVIDNARPYVPWLAALPLLSFASYLWDGIFIGMTASRQMLISMLLAAFIIFFPVYYGFTASLSNHGLWMAFVLFLLGRGLFQTVLYVFQLDKAISSKYNFIYLN
ncbi:MAG: MATE family efflux transporter [Cytophagales bacterium]|nr:MATE family efflux transporter [Cytophagales bacterium]